MGDEPQQLILDPTNPLDFTEPELAELAAMLAAEPGVGEVDVHVREETGYGGPLPEVLIIWMGAGGFSASTLAIWTLLEKVGKVLQGRWKREAEACQPDEKPRDRCASFVDTDGNPLLSIRIKAPDGEIAKEDDTQPMARPYPGRVEESGLE
jgi:hypothetical protein